MRRVKMANKTLKDNWHELNKENDYSAQTPVGAGIRRAGDKINTLTEIIAGKSDRVIHKGGDVVNAAQKNASKYIDVAIDYTKEHPINVTLIVVGIGFLVAKFLSK
jgi:ElaB/YqjD/DUF883 family membrane-anchored ribosome-binding protein